MLDAIQASKRRAQFFFAYSVIGFLLLGCGKHVDHTQSSDSGQHGETFPYLGKSASFAVLADRSFLNSGASVIYGDVGVSQNSSQMSGLSSIKRTGGEYHHFDSLAQSAHNDSIAAYRNLTSVACEHNLSGQDLGGMTLTPGVYCFDGDANLSGLLKLDFQGNKNAIFVFQVGGRLQTANNARIDLLNSGETCNVYWAVASTAVLKPVTNFTGDILALGDITMQTNAVLNGMVMSRNGNVMLDANEIYNNYCR